MEVTKKITIRCPLDRYINLKEKLEKLNMTQSEYLNTLIENDLKDNNVVLNQKHRAEISSNIWCSSGE